MPPLIPRLVLHFERFGPYHLARFENARVQLNEIGWDLVGLQLATADPIYEWSPSSLDCSHIHTIFPDCSTSSLSFSQIQSGVRSALNSLEPSAIAIAGWSTPDAVTCLRWAKQNRSKAILMSDTRAADGTRKWWKEIIKSLRLQSYDAALVAGRSHQAYLNQLRFNKQIELGYDVVDNGFFSSESNRWRSIESPTTRYFLVSSRFVPRKNLIRLLKAFSIFHHTFNLHSNNPIHLCLLGDGEQKQQLLDLCYSLDLNPVQDVPWTYSSIQVKSLQTCVFFPGFRQITELPRFYAHASALVHPAESEPWGLVINEAMACSLPVLSSLNCGAAEELVTDSHNGFLFDPLEIDSISNALLSFARLSLDSAQRYASVSYQTINTRLPLSAFGAGLKKLVTDHH